MVAQSPAFVVQTASTRFDDGDKFLTADLAHAADQRTTTRACTEDGEGMHGHVADANIATEEEEKEEEEGAGDAGGESATDSQTEGEEEADAQGAAFATSTALEDLWGMYADFSFII